MTCRAKDPSTCWKHGNPTSKSLKNLFDPYTARTTIRAATKATDLAYVAQDSDAFIEAKGELELAQLNYDSSVYGLADLDKKLNPSSQERKELSYAERIDLEMRKANALSHREELLTKDANAFEAKKTIANIKSVYGVREYASAADFYEDRNNLNQLPYGTPILVETENGYFIDRTGGGEKPGSKKSIFGKLVDLNPKFMGTADEVLSPSYSVLLASSGVLGTWASGFKKITVLSDAFSLSSEPLAKYSDKLASAPMEENGRYAVTGNGFYYEFEGRVEDRFGGFNLKSPRNDVNYDNYVRPEKVTNWYRLSTVPRLVK